MRLTAEQTLGEELSLAPEDAAVVDDVVLRLERRISSLEAGLAACRRGQIEYLEMLAQQYPAAQSIGGTYLPVLLREKVAMLRYAAERKDGEAVA